MLVPVETNGRFSPTMMAGTSTRDQHRASVVEGKRR
jgi:hypothetical protein